MFCTSCGSSIPDNTRFCAACGTPVPGTSPGAVPPSLHWVVVLLLAIFTGVFGYVWLFIQASFVEKLDPASRIMRTLMYAAIAWAVSTAAMIIPVFFVPFLAAASSNGSSTGGIIALAVMFGAAILISMVHFVFLIQAVFAMRAVLVRYYNEVEPYGLQLSGVMTFFFNILYFQYHLTKIAEWKRRASGVVPAPLV